MPSTSSASPRSGGPEPRRRLGQHPAGHQDAPGTQWGIARELRRRIKYALDGADIEIPFPQRTVWLRTDTRGTDTPLIDVASREDGQGRPYRRCAARPATRSATTSGSCSGRRDGRGATAEPAGHRVAAHAHRLDVGHVDARHRRRGEVGADLGGVLADQQRRGGALGQGGHGVPGHAVAGQPPRHHGLEGLVLDDVQHGHAAEEGSQAQAQAPVHGRLVLTRRALVVSHGASRRRVAGPYRRRRRGWSTGVSTSTSSVPSGSRRVASSSPHGLRSGSSSSSTPRSCSSAAVVSTSATCNQSRPAGAGGPRRRPRVSARGTRLRGSTRRR